MTNKVMLDEFLSIVIGGESVALPAIAACADLELLEDALKERGSTLDDGWREEAMRARVEELKAKGAKRERD